MNEVTVMNAERVFDIPFGSVAETGEDFLTVEMPEGTTHVRVQYEDGSWDQPTSVKPGVRRWHICSPAALRKLRDDPTAVLRGPPQQVDLYARDLSVSAEESPPETAGRELADKTLAAYDTRQRLCHDMRLRRVPIPEYAILDAFLVNPSRLPDYFRVLRGPNLPDGYEVVSVHHDHLSKCFDFTIAHESFTPVPEGDIIPPLAGPFEWRWEAVPTRKEEPMGTHRWSTGTVTNPVVKNDICTAMKEYGDCDAGWLLTVSPEDAEAMEESSEMHDYFEAVRDKDNYPARAKDNPNLVIAGRRLFRTIYGVHVRIDSHRKAGFPVLSNEPYSKVFECL